MQQISIQIIYKFNHRLIYPNKSHTVTYPHISTCKLADCENLNSNDTI